MENREEIERKIKEIDIQLVSIRRKMEKIGMNINSKSFRLLAHQESELMSEKARLMNALRELLQGS